MRVVLPRDLLQPVNVLRSVRRDRVLVSRRVVHVGERHVQPALLPEPLPSLGGLDRHGPHEIVVFLIRPIHECSPPYTIVQF